LRGGQAARLLRVSAVLLFGAFALSMGLLLLHYRFRQGVDGARIRGRPVPGAPGIGTRCHGGRESRGQNRSRQCPDIGVAVRKGTTCNSGIGLAYSNSEFPWAITTSGSIEYPWALDCDSCHKCDQSTSTFVMRDWTCRMDTQFGQPDLYQWAEVAFALGWSAASLEGASIFESIS
jgi:hypothetical protein